MATASRPSDVRVTRPRPDVVVNETNVIPAPLRRISWGAILAGVVIALIANIALNMLGLSIGANTVNPATEADPFGANLGTGAVIWMAASALLSLFAGGLVAGRLSGNPDDLDGVLHGLVTWAVVTVVTLWFVTSSIGSVLGGVANVLSQGVSLAGQGVAEAAPQVAQALDLQGATLQSIEQEARTLLRQTGDPALQPDAISEQADQAGQIAQDAAGDAVQTPTLAELQFRTAITEFLSLPAAEEADRQDVINVIVERTGMTEEEARQTLERWETAFVEARQNAEETLETVGQSVADAVAALGGVVFAAMLLGAFAAGAGGLIGAPRYADPRIENSDYSD